MLTDFEENIIKFYEFLKFYRKMEKQFFEK